MLFSWLLVLCTFLQPGILVPKLEVLRPVLALSVLAAIVVPFRSAPLWASPAADFRVLAAVFVFIGIQVLSVMHSGLESMLETFLYWYRYAVFVLLFVWVADRLERVYRLLWAFLLAGLFVAGYGLYARFVDPRLALSPGLAMAYGFYENQNDYTILLVPLVPFFLLLPKVEPRRFARLTLRLGAAASIAGVIFSLSRGGLLTLTATVGLVLLQATKGFKRITVIALFVGAALVLLPWAFEERAGYNPGYSPQDARWTRIDLWRVGEAMVADRPLLGVGSGRFTEYLRQYTPPGVPFSSLKGKNAHNTYVEVAATSGLLGLGAFLWFTFRSLRLAARATSRAYRAGRIDLAQLGVATWIALLALLVRISLDAKPHEWTLYFLVALTVALARVTAAELGVAATEAPTDAESGTADERASRLPDLTRPAADVV